MSLPVTRYKPGDKVEGYTILREMGEGAASIIYVVQDPKSHQVWALKHVEKHDQKDTRFLDQAILEHGVAQKFNHVGLRRSERLLKRHKLLRLTEVFVVMEFADGISMEKDPPRRNIELAVDLFHQVALALAHMHEKGYVHADMKPNNIIVCDTRIAKVIDLGQSCPIGTVKPRIQGTPDYIAPEQVHRRPITPKTDVYNFGATIYWVMTGETIPTALSRDPDALVSRVDDKLLKKAKPAISLNAMLPPKLNELIMQCIEPEEDNRPATMHDVADRLAFMLGALRTQRTMAAQRV
jgi:serine/threonine-protein kinase